MKKDAHDKYRELSSQSAVSRALHSIRTRYSLATAFFLLLSLLVFYIGGRIVLVHMMREAERQVEEIGYDISRLAYSQAEAVARDCRKSTADIARLVASGEHPSMVLSRPEFGMISLVLEFSGDGVFKSGAARGIDGVVQISPADIAPYAAHFSEWLGPKRDERSPAVGLVLLCGRAHYVFRGQSDDAGRTCIVAGAPFSSSMFTSSVNDGFSGRRSAMTARPRSESRRCFPRQ